jgi:ankyrin repeat protein
VNQVKALLDEGQSVEAMQDSRTPLCVAAMNGHVSVIQLLLARGAQLNYKDQNGQTPLMYAAGAGKLDAVKALVEQKAEIEATTQMGETALMGAVGHGYVDVAKFLVEKGANIQAKMNNGRNVYIMAWERYNGPLPKKDDTALFVWLREKADPKVAKQMDSAAKASEALVREVEAKTGGPSKKK